jgi:rhodanese-related sulfurtransferase
MEDRSILIYKLTEITHYNGEVKMRRHILALFAAIAIAISLLQTPIIQGAPYTDITAKTAHQVITSGICPDLVILDVRTRAEFDEGHIRKAFLIPHSELEERIDELAEHKIDAISPNPAKTTHDITLEGILTDQFSQPLASQTVKLYYQECCNSGTWQFALKISTNAYGAFFATGKIQKAGTYEVGVYYPGLANYEASYQLAILLVQP